MESKKEIINKINYYQKIVNTTNSIYLKRDYIKCINKLKRKLKKLRLE